MSQWKTPVLVIADDFTGANDAGSALARAGARVQVLFNSASAPDEEGADVLVINTNSRAISAGQAAERTAQTLHQHAARFRAGWIYKKIDSTLRGNIGAEVQAALTASGKRLALVVPAVPRLGRVTRNGDVYLHNQRLTETEFASDPLMPVTHANVLEQLQLEGVQIKLAQLHNDAFAEQLAGLQGVVVVDAEEEKDIARLIALAARLTEKPLLVGAAGLGDALAAQLSMRRARPVLAVIGSMSASARQQIERLTQQRDSEIVDVFIEQGFQQPAWPDMQRWITQSIQALSAGKHTVIRTCQHADQRHAIDRFCVQQQISRQQLGETICHFLGELTLALLRQQQPAALYLSGGDVAIAVAQALGASGFQIQGLTAGCVPHGFLLNSKFTLPVMTKAGGFGNENTLVDAIAFIEEKSSE